jgi:hypothetical protein
MTSKWFLRLLLILGIPVLAIFSQCSFFDVNNKPDPRGQLYAGSASCIKCHRQIYEDYLHTAHFMSTRHANENTVSGSLKNGANSFLFDKNSEVRIEKRDSGLYQAFYQNGKAIDARRFAITVGGVKAESYLYWKGNKLFQLPVSYFKPIHQWTNSPGYDSTYADFSRPITSGCLACHASYAGTRREEAKNGQTTNEFDENTMILGIDCERCHGPAADHVYYQSTHSEDKTARHIITYASLTRDQKINMCAVCHSGSTGVMLRSTYTYKPNDRLADYKLEDLFQPADPTRLDVHDNQSRLLETSKCYLMSQMSCATCHDLHHSERQQVNLYSEKCLSCHSTATHNTCKLPEVLQGLLPNNCIDCHMPIKPSNIITVRTSKQNRVAAYFVRNHHIAVYPDEAKKILAALKNK